MPTAPVKKWLPLLLRCPVCGRDMELAAGSPDRVICENGHSYDAGRWINFLTKPVTDYYGKALFKARSDIWAAGIFDPLARRLAEYIGGDVTLLDAGCGEGSPLMHTLSLLPDWRGSTCAVGVDLSKDAVRMASGIEKDISWLVCDLTRLPFRNGVFDIVLNLLSPACYEEFARVLKPGGLLLKVVPEDGYLREIRELTSKASGSIQTPREAVTERLAGHFSLRSSERLTINAAVPENMKERLVRMTPMCADMTDDECASLAARLGDSVCIDLTILAGVKR